MPAQGPVDREGPSTAPAEFAELFERYHEAVFRHITLMLGRDRTAVDDVAQETWLRIHRGLKAFEGRSGFYAWACRIASNEVKRWWERNRRPTVMGPEPSVDPREGIERDDLVHQALQRIPEEMRQTLLLYLWEGFSVAEVAHALDVPEGTVKSRLHWGRVRFKEVLLELGGQP
jgi:RNA polymerase sigma-70 factor (ECF subfamily)